MKKLIGGIECEIQDNVVNELVMEFAINLKGIVNCYKNILELGTFTALDEIESSYTTVSKMIEDYGYTIVSNNENRVVIDPKAKTVCVPTLSKKKSATLPKSALAAINDCHHAVENIAKTILSSISFCENHSNRVISDVHFDPVDGDEGYIEVWVVSDCDGWAEETKLLFSFFEDELSFRTEDFIGKTEREAIDIFEEKTKAYLRS